MFVPFVIGSFLAQRVLVNEYRSISYPPRVLGPFPIFISNSRGADRVPLVEIYLFSLLPILLFILSLLHVPFYTRSPCCTSPHFSRCIQSVDAAYARVRAYTGCTQRWLIDWESTLFYWSLLLAPSPAPLFLLNYSRSIAACTQLWDTKALTDSMWQRRG